MNDQDVDRALRAAGARLRSTAPTETTTDEAWGQMLARPPARSHWRWTGPALVVAAVAASIVGVLVVTRPEDSLRQIPAATTTPSTEVAPSNVSVVADSAATAVSPVSATGTPVPAAAPVARPPGVTTPATTSTTAPLTTTTIAPTVATTAAPVAPADPGSTATTTAPPTPAPAFVGNPSLSLPAAVLGCRGDLAAIAAATPADHFPITALDCRPDTVRAVGLGGAVAVLQRDGDAWSYTGPGDFNVALPVPPDAVLAQPMGDVDPVDATAPVQAVDLGPAGTDVAAAGQLIGATLADWTEPVPRIAVDIADGAAVVFVSIDGLPDDSAQGVVYAVWYRVDGDRLVVIRAFQGTVCSRGTTDLDGRDVCV